MQNSVSIIGLTFDIASVGLDESTKLSNILSYRNDLLCSLMEETSKSTPCKSLISLYANELKGSDSILEKLVK
jgi:hypothetical protein